MTSIANYGMYTIQCRLGGDETVRSGFVHVPGASLLEDVGITQYTYDARGVLFTGHFEWLFIATGEPADTYYIVNRRSGLCLYAPWESAEKSPQVRQGRYDVEHDDYFRFTLEPVHPETSTYKILSFPTGYVLEVAGAKPDNKMAIQVHAEEEITVEKNQWEFAIEPVADFVPNGPDATGHPEPGGVGRPPQIATLDDELPLSFPDRSQARVVDRAFLPFFAVVDPGLARHQQAEVSPYYTLNHWIRWDKARDRLLDGYTKRTTTETTTVGMTQFEASVVSRTFHWEVEASIEASYNGGAWSGSAKLSSTIGGEITRTNQHSSESRTDQTTTEEVVYPELGRPYRVVTWMPADVYELCRAGEQQPMLTWSVNRQHEQVVRFIAEPSPPRDQKKRR